MESVTLPFALRLAAIIQLLSSSALRGTTFNKTEALCHHLRQAATAEDIDPCLHSALREVLDSWQGVSCHPASIAVNHYPAIAPGYSTH